jgi:hypothetical protein
MIQLLPGAVPASRAPARSGLRVTVSAAAYPASAQGSLHARCRPAALAAAACSPGLHAWSSPRTRTARLVLAQDQDCTPGPRPGPGLHAAILGKPRMPEQTFLGGHGTHGAALPPLLQRRAAQEPAFKLVPSRVEPRRVCGPPSPVAGPGR